jgi:dTDP-4-amino-4,6-dideoxygalactose transaminase
MAHIPLVDLHSQYASIKNEIDSAIRNVIESTAFVSGPAVRAFEEAFARFCDVPHVVSVANGTDAIAIALHALGIGRGDEVITVPNTFIATAEAITMTGATPVFVDVHPDGLIDPARVEPAITGKTKAVIPVHLYGQAADIAAISAITRPRGIVIVEDAAQAHGARLRGRRVSGLGDVGTFSFYPGKNLGAYGDGGAIAINDAALAGRCARLRDHGRVDKYVHEMPGYNSRLDTLQAAILSVKLASLDGWNAARRRVAHWYHERLAGVADLVRPVPAADTEPVWHLYVVHHPKRDALRKALTDADIGCGIHYPVPLHLQPAYRSLGYADGRFPVTERLAATCLSLPIFPELTESAVDRIAEVVRGAL